MPVLPRTAPLAGALLLAACTATGPAATTDPTAGPSATAAPATAAPATAAPATAAPATAVPAATPADRDCASLVSVGLGDEAWRAAPSAGPAVFAPLDYAWGDRAGFAARAADGQGWRRFKVAMRLRPGTPATVTVAAPQRGVAALTYRNGLDDTVTFAACGDAADPPPVVEFAGGFALREPACLAVDVTWPGGAARAVLDFGKGGC
ncbi:hypothetical protein Daura_33520 [Dactylosporangium aurantiacum]|uniref:Secreted protein n=1 Tax=Dactylosporangium aurantiacum TaxID=35754 RepID=A0A9Q9MD35_9ACTN|nr:hypothetical protein [Dactylosporangium aurantiacum]MDG6105114.1 hypothetical protein [Dactylosporangium aurantiacum]UWZ51639.1 hypothetical protein Daura_33520 [Dactylosporangium aurantiacum]